MSTTYGTITYGDFTYGDAAPVIPPRRFTVREYPPSRISLDIETPQGRHTRWGEDETHAGQVLQDYRHSSSIPGGFKEQGCKLARKPGRQQADLVPLSTLTATLPGGHVISETRLERTPETSGDEVAITPAAVGFQAELEDRKDARFLGVDRDLSKWQGPGTQRRLALNPSYGLTDSSVVPDDGGLPALKTGFNGAWPGRLPLSEAIYDSKGLAIGAIDYQWLKSAAINAANTDWYWSVGAYTADALTTGGDTGSLRAAGPGQGTFSPALPYRYWATVILYYLTADATAADDAIDYDIFWTELAVWGNHNVTRRGPVGAQGLYASDLLPLLLSGFTSLNYSEGADGTIKPTSFVIEQFAQLEPTTALELVKQAVRFHTLQWAVWEDKTFWFPSQGKAWRASVGPSGLEGQGQAVDKLWGSVVVSYSDVDGTTRTVGPPGSGANTEDATLAITDEESPAYGSNRRDLLTAGTLTPAGAIELGVRFLEQSQLLDTSGQATLVGFIEDDRGVGHSVAKVRAGDTVSFSDAAASGPRTIVEASYDHPTRTCSVSLDAPPEGLAALIERLGVVLTSLGV